MASGLATLAVQIERLDFGHFPCPAKLCIWPKQNRRFSRLYHLQDGHSCLKTILIRRNTSALFIENAFLKPSALKYPLFRNLRLATNTFLEKSLLCNISDKWKAWKRAADLHGGRAAFDQGWSSRLLTDSWKDLEGNWLRLNTQPQHEQCPVLHNF